MTIQDTEMTCDSCSAEMTKGFPATSHDLSSFNLERMSGEIAVGKTGVKDREDRERFEICAWACKACGRIEFRLVTG